MLREPGVLEAEAQVGKRLDGRARITSKELVQLHSVKNGIPGNLGTSALTHTARLTNSPARSLKRMVTKMQWLFLKSTRQLDCVFQDMEPPKSSSIVRKSSNILKPIRCVQFTKAVLRHANIRDQKTSLGIICPGDPHQRNPNVPEFEDRSREETERQERCALEAAWKLAKSVFKLKEQERAAFFSPSENRSLPASTLKLE